MYLSPWHRADSLSQRIIVQGWVEDKDNRKSVNLISIFLHFLGKSNQIAFPLCNLKSVF